MARGIPIAQLGCPAEESWENLVEVSQRSSTRMRDRHRDDAKVSA
jgi:hypothetical protein